MWALLIVFVGGMFVFSQIKNGWKAFLLTAIGAILIVIGTYHTYH